MRPTQHPSKVLIADDQPDVADALGGLIRSLGHEAFVAYAPETAVEIARRAQPDIAIVDFSLRDGYGRHLAAKLRAVVGESLRLVAISGYDIERVRREGGSSFDEFMTKPPELDALLRLLRDFRDTPRDR